MGNEGKHGDARDQPIFDTTPWPSMAIVGGKWRYLMGLQDVPSHHMWVNVLRIPVSVAHKLGLHLERYRRVQPGPCRLPAQEIGQLAGNYSVAQVLAGYRDSSEVS